MLSAPTLLLPRKSVAQQLFDPNLGIGAAAGGLSALNSDWLTRILAAGGASPSAATFAANDVWYASVLSAGLVTTIAGGKLQVVNTYAPDNLIACITPLIKGGGFDSWTNSGPFVSGDLTVNGLAGDGSSKYLRTNQNPATTGNGASGNHLCVYVHTDDRTSAQTEIGSGTDGTTSFRCYYHYSDNKTYASNVGNVIDNGTILGTSNNAGYMCQSRTSTTNYDTYFANSGAAHASLFNTTANIAGNLLGTWGLYVHASDEIGSAANLSKKRISYVTMGYGLTSTESLANYNAAQALRTAYGGGYV